MANDVVTKRFLKIIGKMESNNGKNTNHSPAEYGVSKGDTAVGKYGLMPKTIQDLKENNPSLKDVEDEEVLAKRLAEQVLERSKGDEAVAAGLWRFGHYTDPKRFEEIKKKDYPQEYLRNLNEMNIPDSLEPNPMNLESDESIVPQYSPIIPLKFRKTMKRLK